MDPVVLFDGVCNLCNASVRFILARDRRQVFRFAALQSRAARRALETAGAGPAGLDSVVLVDDRGVHTQSEAVLRIAARLGLPWSLLAAGRVLPRGVRDAIYASVARHRYRWFGRRDACPRPTPALRARFLDADEPPPRVEPGLVP